MTAFAQASDVANAWRTLSGAETTVAETLLAAASRLIRHQFRTIDARVTDGDIDGELVGDVAVAMVIRRMQNPDGLQSEQIQDSVTRWDSETRRLALTADEIDLLTPSPSSPSGRAFVVPYGQPASACPPRTYLGGRRRW